MPSSTSILIMSAVFGVTSALPWNGPRATSVYRQAAWSPAPTFVPANPVELFRRTSVDVNVCGWAGGDPSRPITCGVGSSCIRDTSHAVVGCCSTAGPCTQGVYTSCMDSKSAGWQAPSGIQNNGVYTCAGASVCYQNAYPGGYIQYGCGASSDAAQVSTSYWGQASDVKLQVVFTGVVMNPTTTVISGTSPTSLMTLTTSDASPTVAGVENTNTALPIPKSKPNNGVNTGVVVGSTIAAAAVLACLLGVTFWCCRRRQSKASRVNATKTEEEGNNVPILTPLKRTSPFSPEFLPSALRGTTTKAPPPEQDITGAFYGGPEMSQPSNAASRWRSSQRGKHALIVSEIEDFSHGYQHAVSNIETTEYAAPEIVIGHGMGVTMGIGSPSARSGTGSSNNQRTQNRDLTLEAFRSFRPMQEQNHSYNNTLDQGWTPQHLRGGSSDLSVRDPTRTRASSNSSGSQYSASNNSTSDVFADRHGISDSGAAEVTAESPEIPIPPKSPLRMSRMGFSPSSGMGNSIDMGLGIGMGSSEPLMPMTATSEVDDKKIRYQLVDTVAARGDVPILDSPGRLRDSRLGRRARS